MDEEIYDEDEECSSDKIENLIIPVWELLFENKKREESFMILDNLINKKVKIWSVLSTTVGGIRGTWKGQVGILTSFDDEFVVINDTIVLSRKFIYRIEAL